MNTITLYKVTCTKAYQMTEQGTGYSLHPWSGNTEHYEGHDDGGRLYALPEGYYESRTAGGVDRLFDEKARSCSIVTHSSGLPQLVSTARSVVLREVQV